MLPLMMSLIAGCATSSGDFCDVADPLRPSADDRLTAGTKMQMLKINRYGEKACGWKP